ncbi:MAG: Crp/Fnr family transcriptional regulator [Elusimicrobia bacterium]|nr:Crp/Fnr family transcriptional regulator [Elusimicrobiota bacterium]
MFHSLSNAELEKLEPGKTVRSFRCEHLLFQEGDPAFGVYCVNSGRIRLYKSGTNGKAQVLRLQGPGDAIGIDSLVTGSPWTSAAETTEKTTLCFLVGSVVLQCLQRNPELMREFAQRLAAELRRTERLALDLAVEPATARMACALLDMTRAPNPGASRPVLVPRRLLAEAAGVTTETAIRILGRFKSRRLIACSGQTISILDRARLERCRAQPAKAD